MDRLGEVGRTAGAPPLHFSDVEAFAESFEQCSYRGFGLISPVVALVRRRRLTGVVRLAHRLDGMILATLPPLHRFCRLVITCVEK